jgi:uncharacterized protein (DUF1697 family)
MPRYAAFLRGVSPMNVKMPELRRAFERADFTNVVTVISNSRAGSVPIVRPPPDAKRVITFLRGRPTKKLALPIEMHGAQILTMRGGAIFSAYVPSPKGALFMTVIEDTLGKNVTTRTWDTVARVVRK